MRKSNPVLSKVLFGMALCLAAHGFGADAKTAEKSAVGETSINADSRPEADADANCDKSKCPKAHCPKGSACAKAHAKGAHAQADCPKGAECPKHKAGEAKVIPEKEKLDGKPAIKPTDAVKTETHSG